MKLQPLLHYCEIKLLKSSLFQRVQLILIPLCIGLTLLFIYKPVESSFIPKSDSLTPNRVNTYEFLEKLEELIQESALQLIVFEEHEKVVTLHLEGEFNSLMNLVVFCETYQSINHFETLSFIPSNEKENYKLKMQFSFASKQYQSEQTQQTLKHIATLKNPFETHNHPSVVLTLYAIVNKEVLINHTWLSLHEKIGEFQLVDIQNQSVLLENALGQQIELKL